ncbi:MAG TPA: 23S rRNA (adenine(2030)-N(6))-methyltransferase RlmJ [Legionellales bacterium]|nr:23S rRNA (adenine(2030)-N(6))-methyltransferase RlmJ [Legionellales bacterium]
MLSYQHAYHAGCYADVVKHIFLTRILSYMTQKDKPFLYLETHSGRGVYDIKDHYAKKTQEALDGIVKLWPHQDQLPIEFADYLNTIKSMNAKDELRYYPGSPKIAIELLRPEDRIYLCELHPQELEHLKKIRTPGKNIYFEETDGIAKINAIVPPQEKRALVFVDPSYELKEEYKSIPRAIANDFKKFPTGVYCIWYPILPNLGYETLLKQLKKIPTDKTLNLEFYVEGTHSKGMLGTGLYIINPPYVLEKEAEVIFKALQKIYSDKKTHFKINE